jgi:hypothetical protein
VDTVKEEFGYLECFSPLPTHLARPETTFYLCPSPKKKVVGIRNNNSFGVQEGAVMTSGEYAKAFMLYIKCSEKWVQMAWF